MRVFGIAGWSGSGKTTLIERLLPLFRAGGLRVSTVKRTHHPPDADDAGSDSRRHGDAGAAEAVLAGPGAPGLTTLLAGMAPADLVLVEGFKRAAIPKLEVHRPAVGGPMLWPGDPLVAAIASDARLQDLPLPCYELDDAAGIARFIAERSGLPAPPPGPPAG
jgi:molybdopterin-guanine dinucleotide biosynthesis protein B